MKWLKNLFSTSQSSGAERRGAPAPGSPQAAVLGAAARRVPFRGKVRMIQAQHHVAGTACDLSEGGIFVETRNPPGVGTQLRVIIELDTSVILHVEAQVRWIKVDQKGKVAGCGMVFESLSAETRAAVRSALDVLEERRAEPSAPMRWALPMMNA